MTHRRQPAPDLSQSPLNRPGAYAEMHQRSLGQRAATGLPPHGFGRLTAWYRMAWDDEIPTRLHGGFETVGDQDILGGPRWTDEWRRYLTGGDRALAPIEQPGEVAYYERPLHAAYAFVAQRRPDLARLAWFYAKSGYDVEITARNFPWGCSCPEHLSAHTTPLSREFALPLIREALIALWRAYRDFPPPRRMGDEQEAVA